MTNLRCVAVAALSLICSCSGGGGSGGGNAGLTALAGNWVLPAPIPNVVGVTALLILVPGVGGAASSYQATVHTQPGDSQQIAGDLTFRSDGSIEFLHEVRTSSGGLGTAVCTGTINGAGMLEVDMAIGGSGAQHTTLARSSPVTMEASWSYPDIDIAVRVTRN